jgi:hypothetical protein
MLFFGFLFVCVGVGLASVDLLAQLPLHNNYRSVVSPPGVTSLFQMTWSDGISNTAQNYSNLCVYAHNPDLGVFGENIAAYTQSNWKSTSTPTDAVLQV